MSDEFLKFDLKNKDSFEKIEMIEKLESLKSFTSDDYRFLDYVSNDEDYEVRLKVAEILVKTNDVEAEKILLKLLKDKDELVRVNACDSLCNSASEEVISHLKDRISKDRSSLVKGYAILSLVDIIVRTNKDLVLSRDFFKNMLRMQKVQWVRINIYKALYILGDEEYLEKLIEELNNRYYRNRCAVVNILSELIVDSNSKKIERALAERLQKENALAVKNSIKDIIE